MIPVVIQATAGIIFKNMVCPSRNIEKHFKNGKIVYGREHMSSAIEIERGIEENEIGEDEVCKSFGCGKILSLEESRCGDRCRKHSIVEKMDIVNVIKFR